MQPKKFYASDEGDNEIKLGTCTDFLAFTLQLREKDKYMDKYGIF